MYPFQEFQAKGDEGKGRVWWDEAGEVNKSRTMQDLVLEDRENAKTKQRMIPVFWRVLVYLKELL